MITPLFYPGQKVVCIDGDFSILHAQNPSISVPVEGSIYTVRKNFQLAHDVGIALVEIVNEPVPGSKLEPNFSQRRFALPTPAQVKEQEEMNELVAQF